MWLQGQVMIKKIITALALLGALVSTGASAGIVYDNGSADHVNTNAIPIFDGSSWGEDDFSFTSSTTVDSVNFTAYMNEGGYFDLQSYGLAFGIYPEVGGTPDYDNGMISGYIAGSDLDLTFTGFSLGGGFAELIVGFDLPSATTFASGVNYWLTLQAYSDTGEIYWAASNGAAGNAFYHPVGDRTTFTAAGQEAAFQLIGPTIDAPGSTYLLAIAVAALWLARKRQGQSH